MQVNSAQFANGICPYPFARKEIRHSREFVPCCPNWLSAEYFAISPGENPWNGPAAKALRRSVLEGDYRFCQRELCQPRMVNPRHEDYETVSEAPIPAKNREAILAGSLIMPERPTSLSIVNDARCNLACPSCRKGHIFTLDAETERDFERVDRMFDECRSSTRSAEDGGRRGSLFQPLVAFADKANR